METFATLFTNGNFYAYLGVAVAVVFAETEERSSHGRSGG